MFFIQLSDLLGCLSPFLFLYSFGFFSFLFFFLNSFFLSLLPLLFSFSKISTVSGEILTSVILESSATLRTFGTISVDLGTLFGCADLQIFKKLNSIFRSQILINPLSIDLQHWSIGTCAQTLNLLDCKESIRCCLSFFNSKMLFTSLDDLFSSLQLTRSCSTYL